MSAEMAQVQREVPVMPPREDYDICTGGCEGEIRRKCKGKNLTQRRKEAKVQRETAEEYIRTAKIQRRDRKTVSFIVEQKG